MTDMDRLIAAVEAGEPIRIGMLPDNMPHAWRNICSAADGSLDAALRLHEALLPGWDYCIDYVQRTMPLAYVEDDGGPTYSGEADNPARAWLLAILRAVKARGE